MKQSKRFFWMPAFAVPMTLLLFWYLQLPVPVVTSNMAQVEEEARNGGYRLIDVDTLWKRYQTDGDAFLLVDTRQEWEHRAGHIAESVNFPLEPTWWARWQKKSELKTLLGPDKGKSIVFY